MPAHDPIDLKHAATPGLLRRLAAIAYDCLLLIALYMLAATLLLLPAGMLFGIQDPAGDPLLRLLLRLLLVLVSLGFFVGFWLRGGQTLGMRAWRIRVVRADGRPLHAGNALLRALGALLSWAALGLGFLWMLVDPERLTWHDRISATRLVLLRKTQRR
jgi:uncharacterized RDD family membrane protein YckC